MSAKKMGLGRGFDSLIPTDLIDESLDPTAAQDEKLSDLRELNIDDVMPDPDQPRRMFDEDALNEIAESIKEHGIIQPLIVTPNDGRYLIVAGERRYRGARLAGLKTVPALVRSLSDQHKLELSLIENLQRRDLNVLETATAYLKLRDQFNMSLEQIGVRVGGKAVSSISNTLRLLRLPESVKRALQGGHLSEGQARPLVGLDEAIIDEVLPKILKEEWSARKIEQFIVDLKADTKGKDKPKVEKAVIDKAVVTHWQKRLGVDTVAIRTNSKGAGQIVIRFTSQDELKKIEKRLG